MGFILLLIVRVFSVVVAIAGLVLVIDTVAGLVKVCVETVKPRHLSLCQKNSEKKQTNIQDLDSAWMLTYVYSEDPGLVFTNP